MSSNKWLLACAALAGSVVLSAGPASAATMILAPHTIPGTVSGFVTVSISDGGTELWAWTAPKGDSWTFSDGVQGVFTDTTTGVGPGSKIVLGVPDVNTGGVSGLGTGVTVFYDLSISGVPEAAAWLMMVLGVGLVGAGLRMRGREAGTLA
jgi:hypothetical protein